MTMRTTTLTVIFSALLTGCSPAARQEGQLYPQLDSRAREFTVKIGDTVTMDCRVRNLQDFAIVWSKGERIISANRMLVRKDGAVSLTPDYSLEIREVKPKDGGSYTCQIDVFGKKLAVTHNLTIIVPPAITAWNNSVQVRSGDMLTLTCTAQGDPPPTITWSKHSSSKVFDTEGGAGEGRIRLGPVSREDAGLYVCTATNQFKDRTDQMTRVEVLYPPELKIEENWIQREEGSWQVELVCVASANPPAQLVWYKAPKRRMSTDDEVLLEEKEPNKLVLSIEKLSEKYFDKYTCEADNILGRSLQHIELSGKPRPPVFRLQQPNILPDTKEFNISWTTESFAPITDYFLYYRKNKIGGHNLESASGWREVAIPVSILQGDRDYVSFFSIKNLENKVVYDVIVRAQNAYGMSEPSDVFNFYVSLKEGEGSPQQLSVLRPDSPDSGSSLASLSESTDILSSATTSAQSLRLVFVSISLSLVLSM